jgi:soluble lytic murein transglycosylase-like protein
MQLMPATASSYQLKQDHFNPTRNIDAGVQHMKDLMERYDSDKRLSLAAYNAGEGAVSKYNGVPPYEETKGYIIKVLRLYKLYKKEI